MVVWTAVMTRSSGPTAKISSTSLSRSEGRRGGDCTACLVMCTSSRGTAFGRLTVSWNSTTSPSPRPSTKTNNIKQELGHKERAHQAKGLRISTTAWDTNMTIHRWSNASSTKSLSMEGGGWRQAEGLRCRTMGAQRRRGKTREAKNVSVHPAAKTWGKVAILAPPHVVYRGGLLLLAFVALSASMTDRSSKRNGARRAHGLTDTWYTPAHRYWWVLWAVVKGHSWCGELR